MPAARKRKTKKTYHSLSVDEWVWLKSARTDPKGRKNPASWMRELLYKAVADLPEPTAPEPVPVRTNPVPVRRPVYREQLSRTYGSRHSENWAVSEEKYDLWRETERTEDVVVELVESDGRLRYTWRFDEDQLEYRDDGPFDPYHLLRAGDLVADREPGIRREGRR